MKKAIYSFLLFLAFFDYSFITLNADNENNSYIKQRYKAFQYLKSHYNPELKLIYESEDKGVHWLSKEKPNWRWGYNQTYWVYSDNLFAIKAVEPYSKEMADSISQKVAHYTQIYGPSKLFEVVLGEEKIEFLGEMNVDISKTDNYAIILRKHGNKDRRVDYSRNVDIMCYRILQLALKGNYSKAKKLLKKALSYWDGKGFYDLATKVSGGPEAVKGFYSNYKIALVLFTARVLSYQEKSLLDMEEKLWGYQNENGGITTLTRISDAKAQGSANTETTSLALMAYNHDHINYLKEKIEINIKNGNNYSSKKYLIATYLIGTVFFIFIAIVLLNFYLKKRKRIDL